MSCTHRWRLDSPSPGRDFVSGVCKFCRETREFQSFWSETPQGNRFNNTNDKPRARRGSPKPGQDPASRVAAFLAENPESTARAIRHAVHIAQPTVTRALATVAQPIPNTKPVRYRLAPTPREPNGSAGGHVSEFGPEGATGQSGAKRSRKLETQEEFSNDR